MRGIEFDCVDPHIEASELGNSERRWLAL